MRRLGFTLVELLVALAILAILASMTYVVVWRGKEAARKARTRAVIETLAPDIVIQHGNYRTRRIDLAPADMKAAATMYGWSSTAPFSNRWAAVVVLAARRDLRRMEMPDRWNDVVDPPNIPGLKRPRLSEKWLAAYHNAADRLVAAGLSRAEAIDRVGTNGSAECLYLIFREVDQGIRAIAAQNEADTDGDGLKEFVDGWGNPIRWLRDPVAFTESDLCPLPMTTEELRDGLGWSDAAVQSALRQLSVDSHDPLDCQAVDFGDMPATGWRVLPLIYSAGPDGEYSISTGGPSYHYTASPYVDFAGTFTPIGQAIAPWQCKDNIHSQQVKGRRY